MGRSHARSPTEVRLHLLHCESSTKFRTESFIKDIYAAHFHAFIDMMYFFFQSFLPKDEGISLTGEVAHQQPSLPSLGVGYKHTTYGTTLPKIPVSTSIQTTTFPTSFPSIIHQEKNKVKVHVIYCFIC